MNRYRKNRKRTAASIARKVIALVVAVVCFTNMTFAPIFDGGFLRAYAAGSYTYPSSTYSIPAAKAMVAAKGAKITNTSWNFNFEASSNSAWQLNNAGAKIITSSDSRATFSVPLSLIYAGSRSHKIFDNNFTGNTSFSNGSRVLSLRPKDASYQTVTATQTISGFDPQYEYYIGFYAKTIGKGKSSFVAYGDAADMNNEDNIFHINSNLGTLGNGYGSNASSSQNAQYCYIPATNNGGPIAYRGNDEGRGKASQGWHYCTVLARPDSSGKINLKFTSDVTSSQDTVNNNTYGTYYTLYVDNLDICVYKRPTNATFDMPISLYNYNFRDKNYARFFEYTWAQDGSTSTAAGTYGGQAGITPGMVETVLEDVKDANGNVVDHNIVFTNANNALNKFAGNVEANPQLNCDPYTYSSSTRRYTSAATKITADLLNGNQSGVTGIFRQSDIGDYEYFDSTLRFIRNSNGQYVYNSAADAEGCSECAEHVTDTGGFYPLCDSDADADGLNHSYHFGMKIDTPLYIVNYKNKPQQYLEFGGDDDFWLFIDGVLAIDAGGTHSPIERATVNLGAPVSVTAKPSWLSAVTETLKPSCVDIYDPDQWTSGVSVDSTNDLYNVIKANLQKKYGTTDSRVNAKLNEMFVDASNYGISNTTSGKVLKPGEHQLTAFYMERCTDASNIRLVLSVNLPNIVAEKTGAKIVNNAQSSSKVVKEGDVVEYTLTMSNTGDDSYSAVPFSDTMPAGMTLDTTSIKVQKKSGSSWVNASTGEYQITSTNTSGFAGSIATSTDADIDFAAGAQYRIVYRAKVNNTLSIPDGGISFTNVAKVNGKDVVGPTFEPSLVLEKKVGFINDAASINYDEINVNKSTNTYYYKYTITNRGDVALTNITVTDDKISSANIQTVPDLAPGQSATVITTVASHLSGLDSEDGTLSSVTNTAYATANYSAYQGADPANNFGGESSIQSNSDTAKVNPARIKLTKTVGAHSELAAVGTTVPYSITVKNTGLVDLTNVVVTDSHNGTFSYSGARNDVTVDNTEQKVIIANLAVNEEVTIGFNYALIAGDLNNKDSSGAIVLDNDAFATGDYPVDAKTPLGTKAQVTDDDTVPTGFIAPVPAIGLEKYVGFSNNAGEINKKEINLKTGETAYYKLIVKNLGNVPLEDVVVSDPVLDSLGVSYTKEIGHLEVGESNYVTIVTGGYTATSDFTSSVVNTASAQGKFNGEVVGPATDSAKINPVGLDIEKTFVSKSGNVAQEGGTATFDIVVTNTGSCTLHDVVINDDLSASGEFGYSGTDSNVRVANDRKSVTIVSLEPGAANSVSLSFVYTLTAADNGITEKLNTASAVGNYPKNAADEANYSSVPAGGKGSVNDSDDAYVNYSAVAPSLQIVKKVGFVNEADGIIYDEINVIPGSTVYYKYTVTNTGNVPLTNVHITDDVLTPAGVAIPTISSLGAGESQSVVSGGYTVPADQTDSIVNTAFATGTYDGNDYNSNSDIAQVNPVAIKLTKTFKEKSGNIAQESEWATFDVVVTNTGSWTLHNVNVTDSLSANGSFNYYGSDSAVRVATDRRSVVIDTLKPGEDNSVTLLFTYILTTEDNGITRKVNTAYADGQYPKNAAAESNFASLPEDEKGHVTDDDSDEVTFDAIAPSLSLVKKVGFVNEADQIIYDEINVIPGSTVYYKYSVTNTGNVPLTNVRVADNVLGEVGVAIPVIDSLGVGETKSVVSGAFKVPENQTTSIVNTAKATGTYKDKDYDSNLDKAKVNPVAISLEKEFVSQSSTVSTPGQVATFSVVVTNTGTWTLHDVLVSDSLSESGMFTYAGDNSAVRVAADGKTVTIDTLAPGAANAVTLAFTYTLSDADEGATSKHNTANAVGYYPKNAADETIYSTITDDKKSSVSDDDDAFVYYNAIDPALQLEKKVGFVNEAGQIVYDEINVIPGSKVYYKYTVTNTGNVPFTNVSITDDVLGKANVAIPTIDTLGVGETKSVVSDAYTVPANQTTSIVNTAYATGTYNKNPYLSNRDDAQVNPVAIKLTKTFVKKSSDVAEAGETATFTVTVTNTGSWTLHDVDVTDSLSASGVFTYAGGNSAVHLTNSGKSVTIDTLAPGDDNAVTLTFTYTLTATDNSITSKRNTATATGDYPKNAADEADFDTLDDSQKGSVTDSDNADVIYTSTEPSMTLEKKVGYVNNEGKIVYDEIDAKAGTTVYYKYTVTNTGNVQLNNVSISDDVLDAAVVDIPEIGKLNIGETKTVISGAYTVPENSTAPIVNTAKAAGIYNGNNIESNEDTAKVNPIALKITKTAVQPTEYLTVGDTVKFTVVVTNIGSVALSNVEVTDEIAGTFANDSKDSRVVLSDNSTKATIDSLSVGDENAVTLTFNHVLTASDISEKRVINTGAIAQVDNPAYKDDPAAPEKIEVKDSATVPFTPLVLNLKLDKKVGYLADGVFVDATEADPLFVKQGGTVYYQYTVTNLSNVEVTNVHIADDKINASLIPTIDVLAPHGESGDTYTVVTTEAFRMPQTHTSAITNTAQALGKYKTTDDVKSNKDTATIAPIVISIDKTADPFKAPDGRTTAIAGDTVTFGIVVTNNGMYSLSNVLVTDQRTGTFAVAADNTNATVKINGNGESATIGTMESGESVSFVFTYTLTQDDIDSGRVSNTAYASVADPSDPSNSEKRISVDDDADVTYPTETPNIVLVKKVGTARDGAFYDELNVLPGTQVYYQLTVTNTSIVDVTNVTVTDELLSAAELNIPAIGTLTATGTEGSSKTVVVGPYTISNAGENAALSSTDNIAYAQGKYGKLDVGPVSDTAKVNPVRIKLTKTADPFTGVGEIGKNVTFTVRVTNTGTQPLYNVVIGDSITGTFSTNDSRVTLSDNKGDAAVFGTATIDVLDVGEASSVTLTFTHTLTAADIAAGKVYNTADVTGYYSEDASVTDPENMTNTVTDDDDATVEYTLPAPAIKLAKYVGFTDDANEIIYKNVNVKPDTDVYYAYVITNTGNVDLTSANVTDDVLSEAGVEIPTAYAIKVGESKTVVSEAYHVPADQIESIVNTAYATSTYNGSSIISNEDTAQVNPVAIKVVKTVGEHDSLARVGTEVPYTIVVTNTGLVPLRNVEVTDSLSANGTFDSVVDDAAGSTEESGEENVTYNDDRTIATIALLPVGEENSVTLHFTYKLTQEDIDSADADCKVTIDNTAAADGHYPKNADSKNPEDATESVRDDSSVPTYFTTIPPTLELIKLVGYTENGTFYDEPIQVLPGATVWYSYEVKNTGSVDVTDIVVKDDKLAEDIVVGDLAIGESKIVKAQYTVAEAAELLPVINTAQAIGNYGDELVVSNFDDAQVNPIRLEISKQANDFDEKADVGDIVSYKIVVTNTGTATLKDVVVTDNIDGEFGFVGSRNDITIGAGKTGVTIGELKVGAENAVTLSFEHRLTEDDIFAMKVPNTANASVKNPASDEDPNAPQNVTVEDSAEVLLPDYIIEKTCSETEALPGEKVTFTITVKNTGAKDLTELNITDPMINYSYMLDRLDAGETWSVGLDYVVPTNSKNSSIIKNTASIDGPIPQEASCYFSVNLDKEPDPLQTNGNGVVKGSDDEDLNKQIYGMVASQVVPNTNDADAPMIQVAVYAILISTVVVAVILKDTKKKNAKNKF